VIVASGSEIVAVLATTRTPVVIETELATTVPVIVAIAPITVIVPEKTEAPGTAILAVRGLVGREV